jgi:hypothetical protein
VGPALHPGSRSILKPLFSGVKGKKNVAMLQNLKEHVQQDHGSKVVPADKIFFEDELEVFFF